MARLVVSTGVHSPNVNLADPLEEAKMSQQLGLTH